MAASHWNFALVIGRFAIHIIVGATLFSLTAAGIVLLSSVARLMEAWHAPTLAVQAMQGIELFLFAADLICLVAFVLKEVLTFIRAIWRGDPD